VPIAKHPYVEPEQGRRSPGYLKNCLCPVPTCGRHVEDIKAHMLTHQNERPEKCPFPTCEYHTKGFARKYDSNRHILTHYKGVMVCGLCPGSGSAGEKSFNRVDVFKRHLTSVHRVEQTPPNARRRERTKPRESKASDGNGVAAGSCSTCKQVFDDAQAFYDHLDDCVLHVVLQIESEQVTTASQDPSTTKKGEGTNDEHAEDKDNKGDMASTSPGSKHRKEYPLSWGAATEKPLVQDSVRFDESRKC